MNNKVPDWQVEALQAGYKMNRKTRRATMKRTITHVKKLIRAAKHGNQLALLELEAMDRFMEKHGG